MDDATNSFFDLAFTIGALETSSAVRSGLARCLDTNLAPGSLGPGQKFQKCDTDYTEEQRLNNDTIPASHSSRF